MINGHVELSSLQNSQHRGNPMHRPSEQQSNRFTLPISAGQDGVGNLICRFIESTVGKSMISGPDGKPVRIVGNLTLEPLGN
jgi:hypothetical protein